MKFEYYDKKINKRTKGRYDITPIFQEYESFNNLINDIIKPFKNKKIDKVVGLDALGFIVGSAIALKLKKGLVVMRKDGKLPGIKGTKIKTSFVDYSKKNKSFEMNKGSIKKGEKILIADEWIETGTQVKAAIKLIEKQGGKVTGITSLVAEKTERTKTLFDNYDCKAIKIADKLK